MAEEEQNKIKPIFLIDGTIMFYEKSDRLQISFHNGSTKLVEEVGLDFINEQFGEYTIFGASSKYLANIIYINGVKGPHADAVGEEKRKLLFDGNLSIYKKGIIAGTQIRGNNLEYNGKIWLAVEPIEEFQKPDGLKKLIFSPDKNIDQTIEAIILGGKILEEQRIKNSEYEKDQYFNLGQQSLSRDIPNY